MGMPAPPPSASSAASSFASHRLRPPPLPMQGPMEDIATPPIAAFRSPLRGPERLGSCCARHMWSFLCVFLSPIKSHPFLPSSPGGRMLAGFSGGSLFSSSSSASSAARSFSTPSFSTPSFSSSSSAASSAARTVPTVQGAGDFSLRFISLSTSESSSHKTNTQPCAYCTLPLPVLSFRTALQIAL